MRLLRLVDKLVEVAAVLAFAASSLLICINVLNRYLVLGGMRKLSSAAEWFTPVYLFFREQFGSLSVMADEVPGYLLVWLSFLGAYLMMRRGGHISFDGLIDALPAMGRKIIAIFNTLLIGSFLILLFWQSIRMIRVSGRTEIETAEIAQGWFMAILPVAAVLLLIALVQQTFSLFTKRSD